MEPPEGLGVVELARVLAGPGCGQLLADLGAEVTKVERPGAGDDTRHWGPPFDAGEEGDNLGAAYYHSCNRGKRGVAIDIAGAKGQAELRALRADEIGRASCRERVCSVRVNLGGHRIHKKTRTKRNVGSSNPHRT